MADVATAGGVYSDIENSASLYVTGVARNTGSFFGALSNAPLINTRFGGLWGGFFPYDGIINCSYVWNRVVTPNEFAQLHQDPLAPFRLRNRIVGLATAAPPSTFQPAWAENNHLIGAM